MVQFHKYKSFKIKNSVSFRIKELEMGFLIFLQNNNFFEANVFLNIQQRQCRIRLIVHFLFQKESFKILDFPQRPFPA